QEAEELVGALFARELDGRLLLVELRFEKRMQLSPGACLDLGRRLELEPRRPLDERNRGRDLLRIWARAGLGVGSAGSKHERRGCECDLDVAFSWRAEGAHWRRLSE